MQETVILDSLIRHILTQKGNHLGWVRMVLGVPGSRNVTFDDVKQALAVRVLPEWLRLVVDKGNRSKVPRCLTPSVYGEIF